MRYSVDWQDGASNAAAEERATVADFRLWLADQNVCLNISDDSDRATDHVTIALHGLIDGLVHDWWSLFGGRDRELSWLQYRLGYVVPDIRMSFDGAAFEISARQHQYRNPPIRFWSGPAETFGRTEAEHQLGTLIAEVLDRLEDSGVPSTSARRRWERVQASRSDPEETAFCEAAGALRLDPYAIDDRAADTIEAAGAVFDGEPLTEFLAGARGSDEARLLAWVAAVEARPRYKARVAELAAVAGEAATRAPARDGEPGWSLGYRRARAMRQAMGLGTDARFPSFRRLAEMLGAGRSFEVGPAVDGLQALRSDHEDGVRVHLRAHGGVGSSQFPYLFAFTRAVGDVACFPAEGRAPVNELHAAYRQAAGRAFAAEFLAPIDEILSMRRDGRDIASVADARHVTNAVVEHQIENQHRIAQACA